MLPDGFNSPGRRAASCSKMLVCGPFEKNAANRVEVIRQLANNGLNPLSELVIR